MIGSQRDSSLQRKFRVVLRQWEEGSRNGEGEVGMTSSHFLAPLPNWNEHLSPRNPEGGNVP